MTRTTKVPQWVFAAGERGKNRVRVYTDVRTGRLFIEFRDNGRRVAQALGHRDKEQAKAQAEELAARLRRPDLTDRHRITLAELFDNYLREVTPTKSKGRQKHDHRATRWILDVVGPQRPAADLTHRDAARYVAERRRQGDLRRGEGAPNTKAADWSQRRRVIPGSRKVIGRALGTRGIAENVSLWQAVLNWGVNAGWLDRNPLRGFRVKQEESPKRPSLSTEEYGQLLAVADEIGVDVGAAPPSPFRAALVLAHETGHRISAIRLLRWSDIDFDRERVLWRAVNDKMGMTHETPLTPAALSILRDVRRTRPGIGDGWVFPSHRRSDLPLTREVLYHWWLDAEARAGLPRVEGRAWHSLRRKFATELKHAPLKDLCALGGWKSHHTVLTCYQQPDADTMREALARRSRANG